MTLTNKALALRRLSELKEIFKDFKGIKDIRRFYNHRQVPFGFVVEFMDTTPSMVNVNGLADRGFEITSIRARMENDIIIVKLELTKFEVEKEYTYDDIEYGWGDWNNSKFMKMAKQIGSENYWRVKYSLLDKENDEYRDESLKHYEETRNLNEEIQKLKEEKAILQQKLLTQLGVYDESRNSTKEEKKG